MECLEPQSPQSLGFCDSQLKPEPLRIANKTESATSSDTCVEDPPAHDVPIDNSPVEDASVDEAVTQMPDQDAIAAAQETLATSDAADATHSLRATSSRLSALMSKFEPLNTMVRPESGKPSGQFLAASASSKPSPQRPALAPRDPNLTVLAATPASTAVGKAPQHGSIGSWDGNYDSSRSTMPSTTPQKPFKIGQPGSSGQKASTRTAPVAQSISERRKMFERLSGESSNSATRVPRDSHRLLTIPGDGTLAATVHTIKPIAVDTGLVSALRSSTPNNPRPRPSPRTGGLSKTISPQSSLRLPRPRVDKGHSFLGAQKEKPFQQHNNHTVADLRRTFECQPATKIPRLQGGSLPNTPKRAQTPKVETRIISPGGRVDKKPSVRRRPADARDFRPFALPSRIPGSWSGASPSRLPTPTTIRQTEGRALKADLVDERRRGPTDRSNATSQNSERIRSPTTPDPQPLLVARTISVKAYTVRPVSRSSKIPRAKYTTDPTPENRDNDAEARRMAPRTAASRSLQHWKTRSPTKSSPSLPVIVSTTIGASTRSGLRPPSSYLNAARPRSRAERPLTAARKENQHGTGTSKDIFGVAESGTGESSMRQRVFVLEQVGRSDGHEGPLSQTEDMVPSAEPAEREEVTSEPKPQDEPSRQISVKKASGWEKRLSSQTLRSFSASARRKLSGSKRRSKPPPSGRKSPITIPKRQTTPPASAKSPVPEHHSDKTRLHRNFSIRATLRKISRSHHGDPDTFPASPRPMSSPSAEQLAKTASIAPRPFYRLRTRSGRFLPVRNSYHGATNSKLGSELVGNDVPASSAASCAGAENTATHRLSLASAAAGPKPSIMDGESPNWTRRATVAALDLGRRFRGVRKASTSAPQPGMLAKTTTAPQLSTPIRQGGE